MIHHGKPRDQHELRIACLIWHLPEDEQRAAPDRGQEFLAQQRGGDDLSSFQNGANAICQTHILVSDRTVVIARRGLSAFVGKFCEPWRTMLCLPRWHASLDIGSYSWSS